MTRPTVSSSRGVTLIEAIVAVLVLSIAVPPTLSLLSEASLNRADTIADSRATFYAQAVMEQVTADTCSPDPELGFAAFEDPGAYRIGLADRLAGISQAYDRFSMAYEVQISGLVSATGVATGEPAEDVFRRIEVAVTYPTARGVQTLRLESLVTEVSP